MNLRNTWLAAIPAAAFALAVSAADLPPLGATAKLPARATPRPAKVVPVEVDFFGANRSRWNVELPAEGHPNPFEIVGEGDAAELRLRPAELKPAHTTVRILLPGDGPANGNVWARNQCNYVAFECRSSSADVPMTFHLLQRGKTAGTYDNDLHTLFLPFILCFHKHNYYITLCSYFQPETDDILKLTAKGFERKRTGLSDRSHGFDWIIQCWPG